MGSPHLSATKRVTHFGLEESHKWRAVHITKHLITQQRYPCLVYGDYNFFDDRDGKDQRTSMLEECADLAYPLYHGNVQLTGTFVGFPHDDFKQSWENMSRLDHIFTPLGKRGVEILASPAISPNLQNYQLDNSSYDTHTYPSDHLALELTFEIS